MQTYLPLLFKRMKGNFSPLEPYISYLELTGELQQASVTLLGGPASPYC